MPASNTPKFLKNLTNKQALFACFGKKLPFLAVFLIGLSTIPQLKF